MGGRGIDFWRGEFFQVGGNEQVGGDSPSSPIRENPGLFCFEMMLLGNLILLHPGGCEFNILTPFLLCSSLFSAFLCSSAFGKLVMLLMC